MPNAMVEWFYREEYMGRGGGKPSFRTSEPRRNLPPPSMSQISTSRAIEAHGECIGHSSAD